jgi:hypothetical protein
MIYFYICSRDSVVSIATGYGLEDRGVGVRVQVQSRIFSSQRHPDRLLGPPGLLSYGVKCQGREADHSPPSHAEVYVHESARLHGVVFG